MQNTITQITHLSSIAKLLSFASRLGIGGQGLKQWAEKVDKIKREADEMTHELAQFHNTFADRGWILTSRTDSKAARMALETNVNSGALEADNILAQSYTGEGLDRTMMYLTSIPAFRIRRSQLDEAVALTNEGRYMSAVPLLLIIADGVGSDMFNRSIFAQDTDLADLDSFAGQPGALPKLIKEICATRRKTRSDDIHFPYRNGIIHGRDLGYGNLIVTAKCWCLLESIADIHRSREGKSVWGAAEPPSSTSLGESIRGILDSVRDYGASEERRMRIKDWKRRPVTVDKIDVFSDRCYPFDQIQPEYSLAEFLSAWRDGNYGQMSALTIDFSKISPKKRAGDIRAAMEGIDLLGATITSIEDKAAALTVVSAILVVSLNSEKYEKNIDVTLMCQDASGNPAIRGDQEMRWKVSDDYLNMRYTLQ